jgi:hypothetical protein
MLPVAVFYPVFTNCKKYFLIALVSFISAQSIQAQKVAPVTQSALTGLSLPAGTKQDKRFLMVTSAKILMNGQAKKNNVELKTTEVLYLPPDAAYTIDVLTTTAKQSGWDLTATDEKEYYWLQQNGRYVLLYFSSSKKEIDLYLAESSQAPGATTNTQMQNNVPQQNNSIPEQQVNQVPEQQNINPPPQQQMQQETQNPIPDPNTITPAINTGFKFNTTNFDDGWNSTEQSDWVEVTKGNIKVLLHYPKEGTIFPADPEPLTTAAWNILVAPRYSNLKNYKTAYISTYNRPYLGMGYATENASGKEVFVVLFRRGESGWLEFVAPDKTSFMEQFKFDPEAIKWDSESDLMNPLANMTVYNKFAVDAADFKGKWTSDFTGIQQLYNVYTGNYAGMQMNQSNEEFVFAEGGTYNWKLLVVNGMVGSANFNQVASSGTITVVNNWQIHFTKIESGPKTYNAFWSCIKGARILNLLDAQYPGSGIYTKYGLAK